MSLSDRARGALTALLLALPLSVWGLGTGSTEEPRWIAIMLVAVAVTSIGVVRVWRHGLRGVDRIDLLAAAPVIWLGASVSWSKDPWMGAQATVGAVALFLVFIGFRKIESLRSNLPAAAMVSLLLFVVLAWSLHPDYYGGFGYKNAAGVFALAALPWAMVYCTLRDDRLFAIRFLVAGATVVATIVWLVFYNDGRSQWAVLAGLVVVFLLSHKKYFSAAFVSFVAADIAILIGGSLSVSFRQRAEIWIDTAAMWWDAPTFGHGAGSFNYLYPLYQSVHTAIFPNQLTVAPSTLAGQAHNDWLQGLAEIGVVGVLLFVALFVVALALRKQDRQDRAAVVSISVLLLASIIEFPFLLPATAFLGVAALGTMARA